LLASRTRRSRPRARRRVDEPTPTALEQALDAERAVVALAIDDRERILRALDECPDGLAELRGVLLEEHTWRRREGLA
jgi:hypothetical protein